MDNKNQTQKTQATCAEDIKSTFEAIYKQEFSSLNLSQEEKYNLMQMILFITSESSIDSFIKKFDTNRLRKMVFSQIERERQKGALILRALDDLGKNEFKDTIVENFSYFNPSNIYYDSLWEAIHNVPISVVTYRKRGKACFGNERTFAYELYRQWFNLIPNGDIILNAEIPKTTQAGEERLKQLFGTTEKGKIRCRFYPDLVCHQSQDSTSKQEVICEIKTKENLNAENLKKDIKKLMTYLSQDVLFSDKFKVGVFILVGGTIDDIIKYKLHYSDIPNNIVDPNAIDNICCMTYTRQGGNSEIPVVECKPLRMILAHNEPLNRKMRKH